MIVMLVMDRPSLDRVLAHARANPIYAVEVGPRQKIDSRWLMDLGPHLTAVYSVDIDEDGARYHNLSVKLHTDDPDRYISKVMMMEVLKAFEMPTKEEDWYACSASDGCVQIMAPYPDISPRAK